MGGAGPVGCFDVFCTAAAAAAIKLWWAEGYVANDVSVSAGVIGVVFGRARAGL